MGHYYAEMADLTDDEIDEANKKHEALKNAVRLGVIAGIEAGKSSVGMDRDGMYAKPVRVAAIVNKIMRTLW